MQAGILNEVITILMKHITKNDFGEEKETLVERYITRAKVIYNNGGRTNENKSIFHPYTKSFQVRYYVPVDDYDIIEWNGKQYRVLDVESNREYQYKMINTELVND